MPSFFDLQKFAATGIASADMSAFDKARALAAFGGGAVQTLTDAPPLSFKADGKPLISWIMKGNGQQTGTPTPDVPIMPEFVGVRTGNLWDEDYTGISGDLKYVPVYVGDGSFTMSTDTPNYSSNAPLFLLSGNVTSGASTPVNGVYNGVSRTAVSSNGYITIAFRRQSEPTSPITHNTMLNTGSSPLPYEPYGWAEKNTCAGQTVPVYLGQTQTVRRIKKLVLTGEEGWAVPSDHVFRITIDGYLRELGVIIAVSSHYIVTPNVSSITNWNTNDRLTFLVSASGNNYMYIRDSRYNSNADAFKTHLQQQYAAGTPVTIWYVLAEPQTGIVNDPLAKIGTYADELSSADAGVSIPTVKGQNTLTVETELQPSSMTITYKK